MFILRRISATGIESNTIIGDNYELINAFFNEKKFIETMEIEKFEFAEEIIFSFLVFKGGSEIMPLYKKSSYYIMSENGKTFANLTFR